MNDFDIMQKINLIIMDIAIYKSNYPLISVRILE